MAGIYMVELNAEPFWIFDTTISWSFLDYTDPNQLPAEYARGDDFNTYDFPSPTGDFYYYYESVSALTTEQRTWIQHLFTEIESFTKLTFDDTETANNAGEMKFGNASLLLNAPVIVNGNTADATVNGVTPGLGIVRESYDPNDARLGAVWLRQGMSTAQFREIAVHEVCHALGLAHPTGDLTGVPMPADQQTIRFSAMGGTAFIENGTAVPIWAEKSFGFQLYDIAALQAFYDENRDIKTDDTYGIDKVLVTVEGHEWKNQYCIWDGGGIDTLSAAEAKGQTILDLREGRFSSIHNEGYTVEEAIDNLSIAFGVEIENAKGGDSRDLIIGNHLNNMLDALEENDVVFGAGNVLRPLDATQEEGDDHDLLQMRNDAASEYKYKVSDEGRDSGNDLIFGRGGDDHLWGGEGTDIMLGGNDNDTLHGDDDSVPFSVHSPDDESDILDGGDGADVYHVGEGDVIANLEAGTRSTTTVSRSLAARTTLHISPSIIRRSLVTACPTNLWGSKVRPTASSRMVNRPSETALDPMLVWQFCCPTQPSPS